MAIVQSKLSKGIERQNMSERFETVFGTEANKLSRLPGYDPFSLVGHGRTVPRQGLWLSSNFARETLSVLVLGSPNIRVEDYNKDELTQQEDMRVVFGANSARNPREFCLIYETPNYPWQKKVPADNTAVDYLDETEERPFETINLPGGGWIRFLKEVNQMGVIYESFTRQPPTPEPQALRAFDEKEVCAAVTWTERLLQLSRAKPTDIELISRRIVSNLLRLV